MHIKTMAEIEGLYGRTSLLIWRARCVFGELVRQVRDLGDYPSNLRLRSGNSLTRRCVWSRLRWCICGEWNF